MSNLTLNLKSEWKGKMQFQASNGDHVVAMDARSPIGNDTAMTPKHLLLAGVCGCTGMDVVALLRKYKQNLESLTVAAETDLIQGTHPVVFKELKLTFKATGKIEAAELLEAVRLSQTQFCGVTAMIASRVPVVYDVELNGEKIGSGKADFEKT